MNLRMEQQLRSQMTLPIAEEPLILLQSKGLIKLSDEAGLEATEKDVVENPKNLSSNWLKWRSCREFCKK